MCTKIKQSRYLIQIPNPSLEEKAVPASNERTKDWVHVSKFEDSWKEDLQQDNLD